MYIDPRVRIKRKTAGQDATVFQEVRERVAQSITSSALLVEVLDRLNRLERARDQPLEFEMRFAEFVDRAADYLTGIQPWIPALMAYMPGCGSRKVEEVACCCC